MKKPISWACNSRFRANDCQRPGRKIGAGAITDSLDERTHTATWLALTQGLTAFDDLNLGWAHVGRTPGSRWKEYKTNLVILRLRSSNNEANLYNHRPQTPLRRQADHRLSDVFKLGQWLLGAYSLGAGGHGLPTRNYVGDKFIGGCQTGGNCGPPFSGYNPEAVSFGVTYDF